MPHSYCSCLLHLVWSTKERQPLITPELRERLWQYLGGIARDNAMRALTVGGVDDHVHVFLSLPSTVPIAKAVQLLKGGSSKWVHDTFPQMQAFAWQEGYGAFSVSVSGSAATIHYIDTQEEHHRRISFQDEFLAFLERHGIEYDPRYVWG